MTTLETTTAMDTTPVTQPAPEPTVEPEPVAEPDSGKSEKTKKRKKRRKASRKTSKKKKRRTSKRRAVADAATADMETDNQHQPLVSDVGDQSEHVAMVIRVLDSVSAVFCRQPVSSASDGPQTFEAPPTSGQGRGDMTDAPLHAAEIIGLLAEWSPRSGQNLPQQPPVGLGSSHQGKEDWLKALVQAVSATTVDKDSVRMLLAARTYLAAHSSQLDFQQYTTKEEQRRSILKVLVGYPLEEYLTPSLTATAEELQEYKAMITTAKDILQDVTPGGQRLSTSRLHRNQQLLDDTLPLEEVRGQWTARSLTTAQEIAKRSAEVKQDPSWLKTTAFGSLREKVCRPSLTRLVPKAMATAILDGDLAGVFLQELALGKGVDVYIVQWMEKFLSNSIGKELSMDGYKRLTAQTVLIERALRSIRGKCDDLAQQRLAAVTALAARMVMFILLGCHQNHLVATALAKQWSFSIARDVFVSLYECLFPCQAGKFNETFVAARDAAKTMTKFLNNYQAFAGDKLFQ